LKATDQHRPEKRLPAPGQCHVWIASLSSDPGVRSRLSNLLSPPELHRAQRFCFEKDRIAFIQFRGILRSLLAFYLDAPPAALEFSTSSHGKPSLTGPQNPPDLRFNLSHSNPFALYAFARSHEVGVDIECLRPLADWAPVAELVFTQREKAELAALPPEKKLPGFFNGWTRKEALLKATGMGFACEPKQIEVSLAPGTPCRLVAFRGATVPCSEWSLSHLDPAPNFVGALAVQQPNVQVRVFSVERDLPPL
jgi:4'-phosphopantetheinyl transferase